ncbi:MAG: hypothetical protein BROFUL_01541 [Candidatus Brocadia fulgida]|uniref:Uncharacterized protein n=1 Tax=Candidatus Brocadia fulgida TaxID=380242 RepID=A0A0M2UVY6_9BACT|nr:MAG: hypothetical protein BROFUL_01541 [Candidatus Brocadia fulgida]
MIRINFYHLFQHLQGLIQFPQLVQIVCIEIASVCLIIPISEKRLKRECAGENSH